MKTQIDTWRMVIKILVAIATAVLGVFSGDSLEREA